jgi:hypothetical protein
LFDVDDIYFFQSKTFIGISRKKTFKNYPPIGVQFLFKALGLFYKTFAVEIFSQRNSI